MSWVLISDIVKLSSQRVSDIVKEIDDVLAGLQASEGNFGHGANLGESRELHCHKLQSRLSSNFSLCSFVGLPALCVLVPLFLTRLISVCAWMSTFTILHGTGLVSQVCGVNCCPIIFSLTGARSWNSDMDAIELWMQSTSAERRPNHSFKG